MKTIGETLRAARTDKKISFEKIEDRTKIKRSFIELIEKEEWTNLPEFPVVLGFVKNIASVLGVDPEKAVAILRRDYPPKVLSVNPKPDVSKEFKWNPKFTFLIGVGLVIFLILVYLGYQYYRFISPPALIVYQPQENAVYKITPITVKGKTDMDAIVKINNQPVLTDKAGNFTTELEISKQTNEIVIKAVSRSGKETEVKRKIIPQLE